MIIFLTILLIAVLITAIIFAGKLVTTKEVLKTKIQSIKIVAQTGRDATDSRNNTESNITKHQVHQLFLDIEELANL